MKIHMVKKGDTLYQIAQKYNVDLDALIALNSQIPDPNMIDVGMKVKIPSTPKPVEPPTDYLYKHVVMQGDTLWKLGKAWNVPLNDMIEANPQLKNPSVLMTGETVYIPKAKPHNTGHTYHGGHGHKKNTAPIEQPPAVTMPEQQYPVNMPTEPIAEIPYTPMPMPNVPNMPHFEMPIWQAPNMPNMEMPISTAPNVPNMEMPISTAPNVPNMEMPISTVPNMPNMEMPISTAPNMPNMEMPHFTSPATELPYHPGPNMEMPFHQGPNIPTPYTPSFMEPASAENHPNQQPTYVSPFSDKMPDMMPEVSSNLPTVNAAQEPASHLFKQFHVPATEVMAQPYHQVSPAWQGPSAPMYPGMPSAEQMPMGANAFPAFNPMMNKDCGCGGPQLGGYPHPIPYPLGAHAQQLPAYGHEHQPMMYPGQGYPGMMMPAAEHPMAVHGFDPMAMNPAYPMSPYAAPTYAGAYPFAGQHFGYDDCGCSDKSRGNEQDDEENTSDSASNREDQVRPSGGVKKKKVQTAVTRSTPKTNSRKPRAKRSPWINL